MPVERALALAQAAANPICTAPPGGVGPEPEAHEVSWDEQLGGPTSRWIVFVTCSTGAYNIMSVAMSVDAYGEATPLPFARPVFEYEYEDEENTRLKFLRATGIMAQPTVTNAGFDEKTRILTTMGKWRGLSDAFDSATYRLTDDGFVLETFEVDATYDGDHSPTVIYRREAE